MEQQKQNVAAADEARQAGNKAFSEEHNVAKAISYYTQGIELNPTNHLLFSNRAAAKISLNDYEGALIDARESVRLVASYAKGWYRIGICLISLGRFEEAIKAIGESFLYVPKGEDRNELTTLMCRGEAENLSHLIPKEKESVNLEEVNLMLQKLENIQSLDLNLSINRIPLAWFVVSAEMKLIEDSTLARIARNIATKSNENASSLCIFYKFLDSIVQIAERSSSSSTTTSSSVNILIDCVHALAASTAGHPDGKIILSKSGIVNLARQVLISQSSPASGNILLQLLSFEESSGNPTSRTRDIIEAIGDLASVSDEIRNELKSSGIIQILTELLNRKPIRTTKVIHAVIASAIGSLCELDSIRKEFISLGIVSLLTSLLITINEADEEDKRIIEEVSEALRMIAETQEGAKAIVSDANSTDILFSIAPFCETTSKLICELVIYPQETVPTNEIICRIPKLILPITNTINTIIQRNIATILSSIASNHGGGGETSEIILKLTKDLIFNWIGQATDRDLKGTALLLLANIARTENVINQLISNMNVIELLIKIIEEECNNQTGYIEDTRIVIGSLAALRNISVPRSNRELLSENGVIHSAIKAIEKGARKDLRVAFEACILILSLIRGSSRRAQMVASEPNGLKLISLIARGEPLNENDKKCVIVGKDGNPDLRVQFEAGRLVAELCCGLDEIRSEMWNLGAIVPLKLMLSSNFDVLKNEALKAIESLKSIGVNVPL